MSKKEEYKQKNLRYLEEMALGEGVIKLAAVRLGRSRLSLP